MALELIINGRPEVLPGVSAGDTLATLVIALNLKADRIAIERNGEIAQRNQWPAIEMAAEDRLEVVHFVGGGIPELRRLQ